MRTPIRNNLPANATFIAVKWIFFHPGKMFAYETEIRRHLFAAATAILASFIDLKFTKKREIDGKGTDSYDKCKNNLK